MEWIVDVWSAFYRCQREKNITLGRCLYSHTRKTRFYKSIIFKANTKAVIKQQAVVLSYVLQISILVEDPRKRVGRLAALDLRKSLLGDINVGGSIGKLVVDIDANTVLIEDVRNTTREKAESC